jgi:hypothetical protein
MSAPPPKELRPPLPEGPFLVVGLARSGIAAARLLAGGARRSGESITGNPTGPPGFRGTA